MDIKIIYEDNEILVVEKPPKIPSQSDKTGDSDMIGLLGREYLGLIHRLDRPVGGVMVYAKTAISNKVLSRAVSERNFRKEYLAVVCGIPEDGKGELIDYLKKLKTINMSKVVEKGINGSKEAILQYSIIDTVETEEYGNLSLLHIVLETGRHHQIRVQLSNAGFPIWGDNKYNKAFVKKKEWTQISLWSYNIEFTHPVSKKTVQFKSAPYDEFPWNMFFVGEQ